MNWLTKDLPPGSDPMGPEDDQKAAWDLFRKAYERQMKGEFDEAIKLYTGSIELYPTAEAYTFRGWTYSFMGMLDEAIEDCHHAITVDPDFGNPYNDIGAYLIEKGQLDDAIEWLERAVRNGDERPNWFRKDPRLASIRQDPRFQVIINSIDARRKQRQQK